MPRKKFIPSPFYFYHIYNRSNQGHWYSIPINEVWLFTNEALMRAHSKWPVQIAQFVLMNNHYHMVLKTPDLNLDKFMYEFAKSFSLKIRTSSKLKNRMFSGRYKWSLIENQSHLEIVYYYVYNNPVRANIVTHYWEYQFSTANPNSNFFIKIDSLFSNEQNTNQKSSTERTGEHPEIIESIKRGLKKTIFKPVIRNCIKNIIIK
ncbi:MAG: transposase [Oligoflexia bacterium]|nr:transposase [Oligoflexia bacterium]